VQETNSIRVVEGASYHLSREVSLAIWKRVSADATDGAGRHDMEQSRQRFHELARRIAARGGRLRPDVGRVTRVGVEINDESLGAWGIDELRPRTPGRETLVTAEARRWAGMSEARAVTPEHAERPNGQHELPGASEVTRALGALRAPWRSDQATSPKTSVSEKVGVDLTGIAVTVENSVATKHARPEAAAATPPEVGRVLASPGVPLSPTERKFFELGFGHDLGHVRIHHDDAAAISARSLGARTYAAGSHIAFAAGQYAPDSADGRQLMAHELAHVVQADHGGSGTDRVAAEDPVEREADRTSAYVAAGMRLSEPLREPARGIHLAPDPARPTMVAASKAEQLAKVSALTRMTVEELDGHGRGKVLIACFAANRAQERLDHWALELQSIPHEVDGNYLWEYFVQLSDYSRGIAIKLATILQKKGLAIGSSSSGFQSLEHLDPGEPLPGLPSEVAHAPFSKFVDKFSSADYDLAYHPKKPGELSLFLQLTYPDGAKLDLDISLISDNRDPAPLQAMARAKLGAAGPSSRVDSIRTLRLGCGRPSNRCLPRWRRGTKTSRRSSRSRTQA